MGLPLEVVTHLDDPVQNADRVRVPAELGKADRFDQKGVAVFREQGEGLLAIEDAFLEFLGKKIEAGEQNGIQGRFGDAGEGGQEVFFRA